MKSDNQLLKAMNTAVVLGVLASLGTGTSALAQSAGCADINGFSSSLVMIRVDELISSLPLSAGETVRISGSSYTNSFAGSGAGWYVSDPLSGNPGPFGSAPLSPIFTATGVAFSETFVVPVGGMLSFGLSETGAISSDLANVSITCAAGSNLVVVSGLAQQQAITTSLGRNYRNRFGSGDVAQPSNGVFASSKGRADEVSAWVSMTGRTYWDSYEGNAVDLTFGLDKFVSANSLAGVMVGVNRLSVSNSAGSSTDATAAMVGVYAAHSYASGTLTDAYLAWSRVSYDASGSSFDTDRWTAGIAATGNIEQATGTLQPRARISASWEDFPTGVSGVVAGTTEQYVVAIGARFDWKDALEGTALKPFASVDLEYGSVKDTSSVRDTFLAPRFGFGVNGMLGGGFLTASIDAGRTTSSVFDAGLDLNYEFNF